MRRVVDIVLVFVLLAAGAVQAAPLRLNTVTGLKRTASPDALTSGTYYCWKGVDSYNADLLECPAGGGSPGGSSGAVQYNNAGSFGGMNWFWDGANNRVDTASDIIFRVDTDNSSYGSLTVQNSAGATRFSANTLGETHLIDDGGSAINYVTTYATTLTSAPKFIMRRAMGSESSPGNPTNGALLGRLSVQGWRSGVFSPDKGQISFYATEDWTTGANGTKLEFLVTQTGGLNGSVVYRATTSQTDILTPSVQWDSATFASCNLETDASGMMVCGVDDTGSGAPAGANGTIQYNNSGAFGAMEWVWNSTSNRVASTGNITFHVDSDNTELGGFELLDSSGARYFYATEDGVATLTGVGPGLLLDHTGDSNDWLIWNVTNNLAFYSYSAAATLFQVTPGDATYSTLPVKVQGSAPSLTLIDTTAGEDDFTFSADADKMTIGSSTTANIIDIDAAGTVQFADNIAIRGAPNANYDLFIYAPSGRPGKMRLEGSYSSSPLFEMFSWDSTTETAPRIYLYRADGTKSAPQDVAAWHRLGGITFVGRGGGVFAGGASVTAISTEAWTSSARGTQIEWRITRKGTTGTKRAMYLHKNGTYYTLVLGDTSGGSCLQLRDTDNTDWTYCTVLNGVMTCSTTPC